MTIKPALSPEQWKAVEAGKKGGRYASEDFPPHGAAASLLYGRPEGFTWDDVDALRSLDEVFAVAQTGERRQLLSLADRIEALLPPRENTGPGNP